MLWGRALVSLWLVAACAAPAAPEPHPPTPPAVAAEPAPPPWEGAHELASNAGGYVLRYTTAPDPIPWGEPFGLRVWLPGKGPDAALAVDAAMPEHGHGMNRVPLVTAAADGGYSVEGLLFHMPGRWELYFDVTEGAVTERAQIEVVLE
jgi:hypothetical protein